MSFVKKLFTKKSSGAMASAVTDRDDKEITVHPDTDDPTKAWEKLSVKQICENVTPLPIDTPIYPDKVRFVCMSDTHGNSKPWGNKYPIVNGDVLLHAGDFTNSGEIAEIISFNDFLGSLPYRRRIVIAGNHELTMEKGGFHNRRYELEKRWYIDTEGAIQYLQKQGFKHPKQLLYNCKYLEDEETEVYGLRIYGSPWQPEFGRWAFNMERGEECLKKWQQIPDGIDILMTHGPPIGHGDLCNDGQRAGCVEMLSTVQKRVKPKYHVFGHIHEGYGVTTDGFTTFINASTCTYHYQAINDPIIFDIPLPEGVEKDASDLAKCKLKNTVLRF